MRHVYWFEEVDSSDSHTIGQYGAKLAELKRSGFPIPRGFIISTDAYHNFLRENNLLTKIDHLLSATNFDRSDEVAQTSNHIKNLIRRSDIPDSVLETIFQAYRRLSGTLADNPISLRLSSPIPDGANLQQKLTIAGDANLVIKLKDVWASHFDPQLLSGNEEKVLNTQALAVIIQEEINAKASGILMTADQVSGNKAKIIIEAVFGNVTSLKQGLVIPDHLEVDKNSLQITASTQSIQTVLLDSNGKEVMLTAKQGQESKITHAQAQELAEIGKNMEANFFSQLVLEWATANGKLHITRIDKLDLTIPRKEPSNAQTSNAVLLSGIPASQGIATGSIRIIRSPGDFSRITRNDIVVVSRIDPTHIAGLKKAAAIVTESGGRMSQAAVLSRQLGIPSVVGAVGAIKKLQNGTIVTVNGTRGVVMKNIMANKDTSTKSTDSLKTATKLFTIISDISGVNQADNNSDGVGLVKAEPLIHSFKIHPKLLLREKKKDHLTDAIAGSLEKICAEYSPRPVIYRSSDLLSHDLRKLRGGQDFEPVEDTPSLGLRGAYRYSIDPDIFNAELEAIRIVRRNKKYQNLWLLLPYVRSMKELAEIKKMIIARELYRSGTFKLLLSVDTPSNVIQIQKYLSAGIDGVSVNLDSLRTLLLGTDIKNPEVSHLSHDLDESVLWALEHTIKEAAKNNLFSSLVSEHATLHPELIEKVVGWGITSITVANEQIAQTRKIITMTEKKMVS